MRLYNTLTKTETEVQFPTKGTFNMFVCGPTVYDEPHLGNARVYLFFDTLVRYLRSQGKKIYYLQNITDIDDKIITRAREESTTTKAIAQRYLRVYQKNMRSLGVISVNRYALATKYVKDIKRQVETLIAKGHAYKIENDGWYFDLKTFSDYGQLAGRTVEQAEDGTSRIDASDQKRNRGDFCLWKFKRDGEPSWRANFGDGRPGWHIEDTAISEHHFGSQYDLHGGGADLIFPHHEAEIAQQESASGKKPFVHNWMHIGLVNVDGKKMSKSLGNFITISDFLKKNSAQALRLLFLQHDYRQTVNLTAESLADAEKTLNKVKNFFQKLDFVSDRAQKTSSPEPKTINQNFVEEFRNQLENGFRTPSALASVFTVINSYETIIWKLSASEAGDIKKILTDRLAWLGFQIKSEKIPRHVKRIATRRDALRAHQQFMHSDALRKQLEELGYTVEDTPLGTFVSKATG